jgi:hypothetical protein
VLIFSLVLSIFCGSLFRASAAIISTFVTPKKFNACFNQGVQKSTALFAGTPPETINK